MDSNVNADRSPWVDEYYEAISPSNHSDDLVSKCSLETESEEEEIPNFEDVESHFKVNYGPITLSGEGLPDLDSIKLSHSEAWRLCKQGSPCVRRYFNDPKSFALTYHAVCDGTDPVNFLVLNPLTDRSTPTTISFWEVINGYWVWKKCRIFYFPSDEAKSKSKVFIIEGMSPIFYEALLKCSIECQFMINSTRDRLNQVTES